MIGGCAETVWVKAGAGREAFLAERYACERDARQSGGFGGGIGGALAMQEFFNRCMVSRGWRLEDRSSAESNVANARNEIEKARNERISCVSSVRNKPIYAVISGRFANLDTGRFSFEQMTSSEIPTVQEANLLANYVREANVCLDAFAEIYRRHSTQQQFQAYSRRRTQAELLIAQLVRRQISWGDYASQANQQSDNPT